MLTDTEEKETKGFCVECDSKAHGARKDDVVLHTHG